MDPISAILGVAQLGSSMSNAAASQQVALENLMFQRQQAAKQERMGQATRTDAYGNKTQYNPATNTWESILTPTQKEITSAGEQEQLKSLTEDAQRKRQLAQRNEQRSLNAEQPYTEALAGLKYDVAPSEGATRNDLENLMLQAKQDQAKGGQQGLVRQALRLGKGGSIQSIVKGVDDQIGSTTGQTILDARQQAKQETAQAQQQKQQHYLPLLQQYQSIINNGGGNSEQRFSQVPQQLDALLGQQAGLAQSSSQAGNSAISTASNALAKADGAKLDFSGLIKAMSGGGTKGGSSTVQKQYTGPVGDGKGDQSQWDNGIDWGDTPDYLKNTSNWLF